MKKYSIKVAILLPVLTVLATGMIAMVAVVGGLASAKTNGLTGDLIEARIEEYASKFDRICTNAYSSIVTLLPVIEEMARTSKEPREDISRTLLSQLRNDPSLMSIWTCWEPDALDGQDAAYAGTENHDATGRFAPLAFRTGSGEDIDCLAGYEDPSAGGYYLNARNTGKPYITDPYRYDFGGRSVQVFTISLPIVRDGRVVGVLGVDIATEEMNAMMNEGSILEDGYLFVLSPSGTIMTHRDESLHLKDYRSTWLTSFAADIDAVLQRGGTLSHTGRSSVTNSDVRCTMATIQVGDTGRYWGVCGIVQMKTANATATQLIATSALIGLAMIAIVAATVFLIVRGQLRGLPTLTDAAERLALGDIEVPELPRAQSGTHNEIELLGDAFARMADGVRAQADALQRVAQGDYTVEMPVRSERDTMHLAINDMVGRMNEAIHEIDASSHSVAMSSDLIANASQNLASSSTEQAASIDQLVEAIGVVRDKADGNSSVAREALVDVKRSAEMMSSCTSSMEQMLTAMRDIDRSSHDISNVIQIIDDIAFQTNILALNASVEAARAGAHGKGFAVVADEVRNLATKSAEAARETSALIDRNLHSTEQGNAIVAETHEILRALGDISARNEQSISRISEASKQQSDSIAEINVGIEQISTVVQANTATAQETASSSQEMSGQSAVLRDVVRRFQLREA